MNPKPIRRTLVKASVSAPLVLTVGKAGAAARTTFTACLRNSEMRPEPPAAVAHADEALRVTRDVFEIYQPDGKGAPSKLDGRYIVGWDNETLYRLDEHGLSRSLTTMGELNARAPDIVLRPQGKIEVLAYLDEDGNVVGMAPEPNGGTWAMKSCYASLIGQPKDAKRWWG